MNSVGVDFHGVLITSPLFNDSYSTDDIVFPSKNKTKYQYITKTVDECLNYLSPDGYT